jgi:Phosphate-starvation-inducible E family
MRTPRTRRSGRLIMQPTTMSPAESGGGSALTHRLLRALETAIYIAVGVFLTIAAALLLVGTANDLRNAVGGGQSSVDVGVLVLDRILLMLIVAEFVYTLGLVVHTHRLSAEPFLYIGLIAVVRRTLIVTASIESLPPGGRALTNLLLQLGLLSLLALSLAVAIFLVRRSGQEPA